MTTGIPTSASLITIVRMSHYIWKEHRSRIDWVTFIRPLIGQVYSNKLCLLFWRLQSSSGFKENHDFCVWHQLSQTSNTLTIFVLKTFKGFQVRACPSVSSLGLLLVEVKNYPGNVSVMNMHASEYSRNYYSTCLAAIYQLLTRLTTNTLPHK